MKRIEVLRKWCKKIGIEIFDKWLIPLDHVTYVYFQCWGNKRKFARGTYRTGISKHSSIFCESRWPFYNKNILCCMGPQQFLCPVRGPWGLSYSQHRFMFVAGLVLVSLHFVLNCVMSHLIWQDLFHFIKNSNSNFWIDKSGGFNPGGGTHICAVYVDVPLKRVTFLQRSPKHG